MEDVYNSWAEDNENVELVDSVHDFLESLSEEYEEADDLNVPYLLDELGDLLRKRKIQRLRDDLEYALLHGDVSAAEQTLTGYKSIEVGQGTGFDPLLDDSTWEDAFTSASEPLFTFGGAAGRFFNSAMTRDSLVGVQAPEKTGRTFWCIEFVIRALRSRRKVAFINTGDLSKGQVLRRLGVRWSNRPMWGWQTGEVKFPISIEKDDDEEFGYRITQKILSIKHQMNRGSVRRGRKKFRRAVGMSEGKQYLRVSCHPNSSINVAGIEDLLDRWRDEHDFVPDVIVVDYADILAPEDPRKQQRDQVNDTWKALRRLSQKRHALVIVPTQADARAFSKDMGLQDMSNFSEDKRKLGHVTGMMALNQSPEEKDFGGMRVNWIVLRESPFNIKRPLYVGTCFTLAKALCCATL